MSKNYISEFCKPLKLQIVCTKKYWEHIVNKKHPEIKGKEDDVRKSIKAPLEIRKSKVDDKVFLIYNIDTEHYLCVVVKKADEGGFIITCYFTGKVKEGELIWRRKTD